LSVPPPFPPISPTGYREPPTCHIIVDPEWYDLLNEATEDEEDMLDLAFNLTKTSRLGCQIVITEELDGLTVRLPAATRNLLFS